MKKLIKWSGITLGLLILLFIGAIIVATIVIDPNDYKNQITQAVKDKTGRTLAINGKIGLTYYPWLGVEFNEVTLSNAPGFGIQPMAALDSLGAKVAILPLFKKQVVVDTLHLNGLRLTLIQDKVGRTNWDDLVPKASAPGQPDPGRIQQESTAKPDTDVAKAVTLAGISIENAELVWHDEKEGVRYAINRFNFKTGKLAIDQPMDIIMSMDVEGVIPGRTIPVSLKSTVITDLEKEKIDIHKLDLKLDNSTLNGKATLTGFARPHYGFNLHVDKFDVDRFISAEESPAEPRPDGKSTKAAAKTSVPASTTPSLQGLRPLLMNGQFRLDTLTAMGLKMTDIKMGFNAKDGIINLSDFGASLYQGKAKGNVKLDVRPVHPLIHTRQKLTGVEIGPLLRDAKFFDQFEGKGNVTIEVDTRGLDPEIAVNNLHGTGSFQLKNGEIKGVDFLKSAREVRGKIDKLRGKNVSTKPKSGDATVFDTFQGSFRIKNGEVSNNDLKLVGRQVQMSGKGIANLAKDAINYAITVKEGKHEDIVVTMKGKLSDPKFGIDLSKAAKKKVKAKKKEVTKKAKKKLKKKYKKKLKKLFQ